MTDKSKDTTAPVLPATIAEEDLQRHADGAPPLTWRRGLRRLSRIAILGTGLAASWAVGPPLALAAPADFTFSAPRAPGRYEVVPPGRAPRVEPSYDCVQTGDTNIGWSMRAKRYTAESDLRPQTPLIVKLAKMDTDRPALTGQDTTPLRRVAREGDTTWFVELAPAGHPITWTFFAQNRNPATAIVTPPTAVLVKSWTADVMGPVNFTTLFTCRPNTPR